MGDTGNDEGERETLARPHLDVAESAGARLPGSFVEGWWIGGEWDVKLA